MENDQLWIVYIIQTVNDKLYTGITNDLNRRFSEHSSHQKGARFFYFAKPEKIVFKETFLNRSEATKREIQIKKLSRKQKFELIDEFLTKNNL